MNVITRDKRTDYAVLNDWASGKINEEDLTPHVLNKLRRVRACYGYLLDARSTFWIVGRIMETFDVSQAQAYRDINLTEKLFTQIRKSNKALQRQIAENMAKEAFRLARKQGDPKSMASAAKAYIEATGCNIDDPDMPDFNKLRPSINVITIPQDLIVHLKSNLSSGPVKRNPEDYAEYEEV